MYYDNSWNNLNGGQNWSDNYNSGGLSKPSFFDDATWSLSPSPDTSTDHYESSSQSNTNTNTDSSSNPNSASISTPDPEDSNWKFLWTEDLLEPRKPTNRTCPTCAQTLTNKRDFEHHIRNAHTNHACQTCHKQYSSARYLQEHVDKSLDCSLAVRASSACPVCGERFGNWAEKNRHH